jgi:hypothetical protein
MGLLGSKQPNPQCSASDVMDDSHLNIDTIQLVFEQVQSVVLVMRELLPLSHQASLTLVATDTEIKSLDEQWERMIAVLRDVQSSAPQKGKWPIAMAEELQQFTKQSMEKDRRLNFKLFPFSSTIEMFEEMVLRMIVDELLVVTMNLKDTLKFAQVNGTLSRLKYLFQTFRDGDIYGYGYSAGALNSLNELVDIATHMGIGIDAIDFIKSLRDETDQIVNHLGCCPPYGYFYRRIHDIEIIFVAKYIQGIQQLKLLLNTFFLSRHTTQF